MRALKDIPDRLLDEWPMHFTMERPKKLYSLVIKKDSRYCLFFLSQKSRQPIAFAKTSSVPIEYSLLQNEYRMLRFIQEARSDYCNVSTPAPFFEMIADETCSIVTSYISGRNLSWRIVSSCNPFKIRKESKIVSQAFSLWKAIHADRRLRYPLTNEYLLAYLEKTHERFNATFDADDGINTEFHYIRNCIAKIGFIDTWLGPVHGDYCTGNLIPANERIYAIDWERSKMIGLPIFDVFMFCSTYYLRHDIAYSFEETYLRRGRVNKVVRDIIRKAMAYVNIKEDLAKVMFEMFLLEMCTIGVSNFNRKIPYDDEWKLRLDIFIKNKELVLNCFKTDLQVA